ncbi:amino acid racemase [Methylobacterium sp. J-068]|nr:amino acid racemase [Methylobacterium sp. J-068]
MLGVLGGMGPMATVDFLKKLVEATPAARDQDHLGVMVAQASDIPDRTSAILGRGPDPLPAMTTALRRLEAAGATRIAMPCNTAHHWHGALQALTPVPILHIVDAVAEALARKGIGGGSIGLLATDGTLLSGIYPQRLARFGFTCRTPEDQSSVMRAIRRVKAGACAEARDLLRAQAEALVASGCRQVVLACTEIPVALAEPPVPLRPLLLDATQALARACVASAIEPASRAA